MDRMSEAEVGKALQRSPDWSETGGAIHRTFLFKDFAEAMRFVNAIAAAAEADQHHPDILVRWNKVTLTLSTHDVGGISAKDFALAGKADRLFGGPAPVTLPGTKPVRSAARAPKP